MSNQPKEISLLQQIYSIKGINNPLFIIQLYKKYIQDNQELQEKLQYCIDYADYTGIGIHHSQESLSIFIAGSFVGGAIFGLIADQACTMLNASFGLTLGITIASIIVASLLSMLAAYAYNQSVDKNYRNDLKDIMQEHASEFQPSLSPKQKRLLNI